MLLLEETNYKTIQLRIKYLNVDNNSKSDVYHPVILTPSKFHYVKDNFDCHHCIDFIVKYDYKLEQLTWLQSVEIYIMPFTIRLEEDFIAIVYEWLYRILKLAENKETDYYYGEDGIRKSKIPLINLLFLKVLQKHKKTTSLYEALNNPVYDWEWLDIPISTSLYINEIFLPAIDFTLTFNQKFYQNTNNLTLDDFSLIKTIAEIFGTTFKNVNEAPIQLKGMRINHIFDSRRGVLDRFFTHYTQNIISTILKIIGSINIIGNPVGLIRHIGSGVVDLIEKPMEGVRRGPLGLGIGVLEGGSSFLIKTFTGTFNSISALTETMGTGLTMLTFDDKYMQKRSKMMLNKPKHVFEGIYEGGRSLYKGFKSGIKGVFINPKEGIEKEGYPGLLKGSIQGLTSLLIKPIGGVFDATAKTAEGLKNTVTFYDDKPNSERFRPPRVFYEEERFIKRYDKKDAKLMQRLQKIQKGVFANIRFLEGFENVQFKTKNYSLVICYEYVILIASDEDSKDVVKIPTKNLGDCIPKDEKNWLSLVIVVKDEEKNDNVTEKLEIRLDVGSQETKKNRKIPEILQALKDHYVEKERENSNLL